MAVGEICRANSWMDAKIQQGDGPFGGGTAVELLPCCTGDPGLSPTVGAV